MAIQKDFRAHVKKVAPSGRTFSTHLNRAILLVSEEDLEDELMDILGDASEGDFDFLDFGDEGPTFKKGFTPLALIGSRGGEDPNEQIEGLLLAKHDNDKLTELLFVAIEGTLVPKSVKSIGKDLAALALRPIAGAAGDADSDDD